MKKCTCKNGKTDPNCPVCNAKGDINLDSFHRLNPEARPLDAEGKAKAKAYGGKTAAQFKLAFSLPPGMAARAGQIGMAGLKGAVPGMLTGAALGGLAAPEGEGWASAARGAALGGLATGGSAALNHGMMTGNSGAAKAYQQSMQGGAEAKAVKDQAMQAEYARQRAVNASVPPKVAMFYEFGQTAALATFAL